MLRKMAYVVAVLLIWAPSHAGSKGISAQETLGYLIAQYRAAAVRPELQMHFEYRPPMLWVTWQSDSRGATGGYAPVEQVAVDLRYAHFYDLYKETTEHYGMVIECWHYHPCYDDQVRHLGLDHGEISYLVKRYASEGIANALNHLAALHLAQRPKDKFDDPGVQVESAR